MRKLAWESEGILFPKDEKAPDKRSFFPVRTLSNPWEKGIIEKNSLRGGEKINMYCLNFFYSTFRPGQTLIALPFWSVDDKRWRVGIVPPRRDCFCPSNRGQGQLQNTIMCWGQAGSVVQPMQPQCLSWILEKNEVGTFGGTLEVLVQYLVPCRLGNIVAGLTYSNPFWSFYF